MKNNTVRAIYATFAVAALSIVAAASPILESVVHGVRQASQSTLI